MDLSPLLSNIPYLLIGNFLRGQEGKGAHVIEVTRAKKVVWSWSDHQLIQSLTTVRALDDPGATALEE